MSETDVMQIFSSGFLGDESGIAHNEYQIPDGVRFFTDVQAGYRRRYGKHMDAVTSSIVAALGHIFIHRWQDFEIRLQNYPRIDAKTLLQAWEDIIYLNCQGKYREIERQYAHITMIAEDGGLHPMLVDELRDELGENQQIRAA